MAGPSLTVPARSCQAITKSDSTTYTEGRGLWVGTGGDVAVILKDDTVAVTIPDVLGGTLLPIQVSKVMSTNTTASGFVIFW